MAYSGYLIKVGTYEIPFKYINHNTYQCVWSVYDFDSYQDADGETHRDAVSDRRKMKVEFDTPNLSDSELQVLLSAIRSQYLNATAKSCNVTAYMPEEGDYKTDKCQLSSNIVYSIRYADENGLRYNPIHFEFSGYGTSSAV